MQEFRNFLDHHRSATKWMIVSDFVIGDPQAFHDAYVYTFFPCHLPVEELLTQVSKLAPQDIKNTRTISDEFTAYLRSGATFSIGPFNT
jgi:hypothetical protein